MISPPLLTIGAFARAVGLSASALRHYDECGLLVPAEVDHATGYRYYTPDLASRARLIVLMREAGVPIDSMRRVLDGPPGEARQVLGTFLEERAVRAAQAESSLREVLATVEADDEPVRPATVGLDGAELASALRQVRAAAEIDPASPLSGVLIDVDVDSVDVVATNRYWMAVRTLVPSEVSGAGGRIVLSLADVNDLVELLDRSDAVALEIVGHELSVRTSAVASHQVEGRPGAYPAHRIVLDGLEATKTRAVVDAAGLLAAIQRARRAEVALVLADSGVRVDVPGDEEVPAHSVEGAVEGSDVTVLLGATLAQRGLASCLGDRVVLEVSAPDRPVVLRSPYQPGFRALVMPIRQS